MANYFLGLTQRTLGLSETLHPAIASMFEPGMALMEDYAVEQQIDPDSESLLEPTSFSTLDTTQSRSNPRDDPSYDRTQATRLRSPSAVTPPTPSPFNEIAFNEIDIAKLQSTQTITPLSYEADRLTIAQPTAPSTIQLAQRRVQSIVEPIISGSIQTTIQSTAPSTVQLAQSIVQRKATSGESQLSEFYQTIHPLQSEDATVYLHSRSTSQMSGEAFSHSQVWQNSFAPSSPDLSGRRDMRKNIYISSLAPNFQREIAINSNKNQSIDSDILPGSIAPSETNFPIQRFVDQSQSQSVDLLHESKISAQPLAPKLGRLNSIAIQPLPFASTQIFERSKSQDSPSYRSRKLELPIAKKTFYPGEIIPPKHNDFRESLATSLPNFQADISLVSRDFTSPTTIPEIAISQQKMRTSTLDESVSLNRRMNARSLQIPNFSDPSQISQNENVEARSLNLQFIDSDRPPGLMGKGESATNLAPKTLQKRPIHPTEMSQFSDLSEIQTWLTDKTQKTLTSTPLPERERGFEPNVTFLTSPLPQGEKGLRDEGTRLYQSTRIQTGNLVTSTSRGQLLRSQSPGTLGNRRSVNEPFFEVDSTIAGSALPLVLSDVSVEPISLPLPLVSSEKVTTRQNASIQQLRSHSPNSIDQRQQPVFSPPDRQAAAQLNELDKPINLSHAPSNLAHAVSDSANLFINSTSESTLALNKLNVQPTQIQLPLSLPTSQSEGVQFITLVPPHDRALSPELHPKLQRSDFVVDRSILDSTDRPILRNLQSSNLPTDRASTTLSPQPTSGLSTVETQGQGQQGILLPRKPLGSVDRLPPELIVDRSVVNAIDRSASDFVVDRPVTNAIDRLISNSVDRLPSELIVDRPVVNFVDRPVVNSVDRLPSELIVDRSILDSVDLSISNSVANRQNTFDRPVIVSQSSILGLPAPDEVAPPATQPPKLPTQLPTQPPPTRTNSDRAQPPTPPGLRAIARLRPSLPLNDYLNRRQGGQK